LHILLEGIVGPLNEKQLDLVGAARDDCERLQGIVEDLLDLSRIQAGKVEVSLTALRRNRFLDAAVAAKVDAARDAGLKIEGDLIEPVTAGVGGPGSHQPGLDNLVGNAIRHSPKGGRIVVRARPEKGLVRFEVEDQGPGIRSVSAAHLREVLPHARPRERASVSGSTSRARSSPRMRRDGGGERAGKRKPVLVHPPGSAARR